MKNVLVVVNFNAGRKKAVSYKKKLHKFLMHNAQGFKFITIDEFGGINIEDFDTVIAMGGDGTINKVVPLVAGSSKALGIIPCGTANLLAQKLGISSNINKAINVLKTGILHKIDTVKINDKISVLRFGTGYDADIICKTPQSLKNKFGYFAYFIAGILFALRLKTKEYQLIYDDNILTVNASCIIAANSANMYRNIFTLGAASRLDDGFFEVFILKTTNPVMFFFEIVKIFFRCYKNSNNAIYLKTSSLKLKNKWLNTHIDGEKQNFKTDVKLQLLHSNINVIAP